MRLRGIVPGRDAVNFLGEYGITACLRTYVTSLSFPSTDDTQYIMVVLDPPTQLPGGEIGGQQQKCSQNIRYNLLGGTKCARVNVGVVNMAGDYI